MTDLEFVCDLARRAGTLALAASRSLNCDLKADESLVTNVDRAVEDMIRTELAERFPGDAFYGEECGGDPLQNERVWICDPVDGTTNMVFGLPIWGVSVGLAVAGKPGMGAFHLPRTGDTFWFEAGQGSFRNGERLQVKDTGPLRQEDLVGIGSEAIFVLDLDRFPGRQRNLGSLAAHWCWTGAGNLRANVSVQDRLHDLGAAYGVVAEAGCAIEYLDGGEVPFSRFLTHPVNLRPLVVAHPDTLRHLRAVLLERPSGIDDLAD